MLAQKLLNKTLSVPKVAEIMQCSQHQIYDAIYNNRISYPYNYKNTCYSPIVQLDLNGEFVAEYNTIKEAMDETGVKYITSCL